MSDHGFERLVGFSARGYKKQNKTRDRSRKETGVDARRGGGVGILTERSVLKAATEKNEPGPMHGICVYLCIGCHHGRKPCFD